MKIILSRKGFDSASGGFASPIFPDGAIVSLPIPDVKGTARLSELRPLGIELAKVVHDLTGGRVSASARVHLDPDLEASSLARHAGWRPTFGQCAAPQSHLRRLGVGVGDLFLFFGWFRQVEQRDGRYRYLPTAPNLHVLFGWLEIGEMLVGEALSKPPAWLRRHPHCDRSERVDNCIYVAPSRGRLGKRGAGTFRRFADRLRLTAPKSRTRSRWELPAWFAPNKGRPALSFHSNLDRWTRQGDTVQLCTVGRGQEFILDTRDYPEAVSWVTSLVAYGTSTPGRASPE